MTLAVILFVSIFCASDRLPVAAAHQSADQATPASKPANNAATQTNNPPAQSPPNATKSTPSPADQTPAPQKQATQVHRKHKKSVASNCLPAASTPAASGSPASSASEPATAGPEAVSNGETQTAQSPPVVCPPPKIVVRQGGTAEPSIQLAGGAGGDQATRQRANQMLGATEVNLKKLAGHQLTQNQQDMLNQIHQFEAQSKTAIAAGDFERGRTLAWKAQLLSEELANPQK